VTIRVPDGGMSIVHSFSGLRSRGAVMGLLRANLRFLQGHAVALTDQVVVSATSFLTTVILARATLPSQVALYSLGLSLLFAFLTAQYALISTPYAVQRHNSIESQAELAGSSLAHSFLLSLLLVAAFLAASLLLSVQGASRQTVELTLVVAAVLPFWFLRAFGRSFTFAHLRASEALAQDAAIAVIQIGCLVWLAWNVGLSATKAIVVTGAAYALVSPLWLYLRRADFAFRPQLVLLLMKRSWELGKWLLLAEMTISIQAYAAYWLSALCLDATATGVFAASMTISLFANPIVLGIGNTLTPRSALALKEQGCVGLRKHTIHSSLLLGASMALFCAVVALFGNALLAALFHGADYQGRGGLVTVLALAQFAYAVGIPAANSLASLERPRAIVLVGSIGALVTVVLIPSLAPRWGLFAAAWGFFAGNAVTSVGRWIAFLTIVSRREAENRLTAKSEVLERTRDQSYRRPALPRPMPVSVVMPTFNRANYLDSSINSVLRQTHADFEFIIVDDGSTDGTSDLLERYAKRDGRITVIRQPNSGVAASRNCGARNAAFDLIAVMDDDDIMLPERLECQTSFLNAHPEVSVATSFAYLIDEVGNIIGKCCPTIDIAGGISQRRPTLFLELLHAATMFRKSDFLQVGGYRSPINEDRELFGRFITHGYQIAVQPRYLYQVRRHASNISRAGKTETLLFGNYIDHNVVQRLNCEREVGFDEYCQLLASAPWPTRIVNFLRFESRLAYDRATLCYSDRELLRASGNLFIAAGLQPLSVTRRLASKFVWRS
jgi:glycosyltransferase involved in cell wall biosynthesis/O-antigen/teichoic acid export membrane protein